MRPSDPGDVWLSDLLLELILAAPRFCPVLSIWIPGVWRVLVGAEASEADASRLAERIRQETDEKTRGFVVRIDSAT